MASEPICCPYCNAFVELPAGTLEEGQRLACSRCGEVFAYRELPREAVAPALPHPLTPSTSQPRETAATPRLNVHKLRNRTIAGFVLGGMAIMAVIGLLISLATQGIRRTHDAGIPKDRRLPLYLAVFVGIWVVGLAFVAVRELRGRFQRASGTSKVPLGYILATITFLAIGGVAVTMLAAQISKQRASRPALEDSQITAAMAAPQSLPALGFLPGDTDLIAGAHVAEALADPTARDFIEHFRLGVSELDLGIVQKWTSLRLQDLDHVVLGLRVQGQLVPRMTLVVRTNRPYDAEAIRKSLHASRSPEPGKKELYRIKLEKSLVTPVVWFADDHTLVLGLSAKDLESVPATPRTGIDHLMPEIVSILKDRLNPGTPLWLVGRPQDWDKTVAWMLLERQAKAGQPVELLAQVQTFGVWFQFTQGLVLNAAFHGADDSTTRALESYFTGQNLGDKKPFHFPPPRPEWEPIYRELGQSLKTDLNNAWLVLQAKAGAETLQKAFHP